MMEIQNSQNERLYLGAALLDNSVLVSHPVPQKCFGSLATSTIHAAMIAICASGRTADIVTVSEACKQHEWFRPSLIAEIADLGFARAAAENIVQEIKKDYRIREFRAWLTNTETILDRDPEHAIETAQSTLIALLDDSENKPYLTFGEAAKEWLSALADGDTDVLRVKTGDVSVDEDWIFTCGGLHVIAGRPGMGKTSLALWIIEKIISQGGPVLFFSLEMTNHQIVTKTIANWTKIPSHQIEPNFDRYSSKICEEVGSRTDSPLLLSDTGGQTIERISMVSQFARRHKNISAIVVDYLQLVKTAVRFRSREEEVSHVSSGLKNLAKSLNIPVIALSQLNRKVEDRAGKRPLLSDLRESGAVEQDADTVAMMFRPEYYLIQEKKDVPPDQEGLVEVNIAKQRSIGPKVLVGKWKAETNDFIWGRRSTNKQYEQWADAEKNRYGEE